MDNLKKLLPLLVLGGLFWFAITKIKNETTSRIVSGVSLILAVPLVVKLLPDKMRSFIGQ